SGLLAGRDRGAQRTGAGGGGNPSRGHCARGRYGDRIYRDNPSASANSGPGTAILTSRSTAIANSATHVIVRALEQLQRTLRARSNPPDGAANWSSLSAAAGLGSRPIKARLDGANGGR